MPCLEVDYYVLCLARCLTPDSLLLLLVLQPRPVLEGPAPRIDPADLNHQTGRWGEELVFSYLQWQLAAYTPRNGVFCDLMYECPSTGWQVEWINYKEETRRPFDVRLRSELLCHALLPARWYSLAWSPGVQVNL